MDAQRGIARRFVIGLPPDGITPAWERDFAAYTRKAQKDRGNLRSLMLLSVARPIIAAGTKAAAKAFFTPDETSVDERLAAVRDRTRGRITGEEPPVEPPPSETPPA